MIKSLWINTKIIMDDQIDSPEEKYMVNSTLIDEVENPIEIDTLSQWGKQGDINESMDASSIQIVMEDVDKPNVSGKDHENYPVAKKNVLIQ